MLLKFVHFAMHAVRADYDLAHFRIGVSQPNQRCGVVVYTKRIDPRR